MSKNFAPGANRREFLQGLSAAAITAWLTGCGGGGERDSFGGSAPGQGSSLADAPRGRVTGTVNTSQVGGTSPQVFSVFDGMVPTTGGSFSLNVSEDRAQALLVLDAIQKLRGLTINLPGQSPTVDARSTAVAIIFLTPGISTTDVETARLRLQAIQAAAGFSAFLQLLQAAMVNQDLVTALAVPGIRDARDLVVQQILDQIPQVQPRILARTQQEETQVQSDGYIALSKDAASTDSQLKINIANEGYRFVKVIREEHFAGQKQAVLPVLSPGTFTNKPIINGRGGLSIATSITFQALQPGGDTDTVDQSQHKCDRLVYYTSGIGNPFHSGQTSFPPEISAMMGGIGHLDAGLTIFFYILLPVIEPVLYLTGINGKEAVKAVADALAPLFTGTGTVLGGISAAQAQDQKSFLLALADVILTLTPDILKRAVPALLPQLVPGVAVVEALLAVVGAALATVNLGLGGIAAFRTPEHADALIVLTNPIHFLAQNTTSDFAPYRQFVNLAVDGSLVYTWKDTSQSNRRRINRLKLPTPGTAYPAETTYDLDESVQLIVGNKNGELLAQVNESLDSPSRVRNSFFSYQLPEAGFQNPVLLGQVTWASINFSTSDANPGPDINFTAQAISSTGAIAGVFQQFHHWNGGPASFTPSYILQAWWIPKNGTLTKLDLNPALRSKLESSFPLSAGSQRADGMATLRILDFNSFGEMLLGCLFFVSNSGVSFSVEQVVASYNAVTGRVILLSRVLAPYNGTTDLTVQAGKINDAGQVALSRSETGIFFGEFYNGIAPAGEPIPTAIGFKDRFFVNDLTSDGQVAGFEQILGTPGVTGKAAIWKAAGSGEVVDVHAQLAGLDPLIQDPYSSSLARLGDDGTMVGVVIKDGVTRDFVIQGTASGAPV